MGNRSDRLPASWFTTSAEFIRWFQASAHQTHCWARWRKASKTVMPLCHFQNQFWTVHSPTHK